MEQSADLTKLSFVRFALPLFEENQRSVLDQVSLIVLMFHPANIP